MYENTSFAHTGATGKYTAAYYYSMLKPCDLQDSAPRLDPVTSIFSIGTPRGINKHATHKHTRVHVASFSNDIHIIFINVKTYLRRVGRYTLENGSTRNVSKQNNNIMYCNRVWWSATR